MIHVQNWKIYASHYNDDSTDLGFELKQAQLHYKQYGEEMGVPVTDEIVSTTKRQSVDDIFPFLFEGTSIHDYNQAQFIERNKNCITIREWQESEVKYADSDFGETCCVDDLFDNTDNNSAEIIGDLLNDIYTKENSGNDDTPMKKRQLFEYETPLKPSNDLLIFKNTQTFLSPTTKEFQRSIDKAASSAKVIYNRNELKAARKNILQSVDHILGHDLVQENPQAAAFVAELERKVQEIKEEFTKSIYSITGTMHGNEGELMFPAFQSRKRKNVDKRFKGLSG
jgi:hypothetical protein